MSALQIIGIVLLVLLVILVVLYFAGRKMQTRQLESQKMMEASAQVVNLLAIDKKKMKFKEAPLPKEVFDQAPSYSKLMKVCVVKAKIGPRVFNLICDDNVFKHLPLKTECKVKLAGIYITEIIKGAVYTEKEIEKRRKAKEKAAKKAAKEASK